MLLFLIIKVDDISEGIILEPLSFGVTVQYVLSTEKIKPVENDIHRRY